MWKTMSILWVARMCTVAIVQRFFSHGKKWQQQPKMCTLSKPKRPLHSCKRSAFLSACSFFSSCFFLSIVHHRNNFFRMCVSTIAVFCVSRVSIFFTPVCSFSARLLKQTEIFEFARFRFHILCAMNWCACVFCVWCFIVLFFSLASSGDIADFLFLFLFSLGFSLFCFVQCVPHAMLELWKKWFHLYVSSEQNSTAKPFPYSAPLPS